MWGFAYLLFLAAASVAIAACAEAGAGEPDAISAVIVDAVVTTDDEQFCNELVSPAYADAVYGGAENCLAARARLDDDEVPPDEVIVADIEVNGDAATATVEEIGGDTAGAKGTIVLTRSDNRWQVDELGIDYLRSLFAAGVSSIDFGIDEAGNAGLAECFNERLQKLDDDTFRAVAYASMAEEESHDEVVRALIRCSDEVQFPTADGGEKVMDSDRLVRREFERVIAAEAIEDGVDRAVVRCLLREMRRIIPDEELVEKLDNDDAGALARIIAGAMSQC